MSTAQLLPIFVGIILIVLVFKLLKSGVRILLTLAVIIVAVSVVSYSLGTPKDKLLSTEVMKVISDSASDTIKVKTFPVPSVSVRVGSVFVDISDIKSIKVASDNSLQLLLKSGDTLNTEDSKVIHVLEVIFQSK